EANEALSGRRRSRLLRTPSLWLELLAPLALTLVLARLMLGAAESGSHLVVLLDDSASLAAGAPGATSADRGPPAVAHRPAGRSGAAPVTVITPGPRPRIVLGPKAPKDEARAALAAWTPRLPRHDPTPALQLGAQLLAREEDRAVFVTDEPPATLATVPSTV